MPSASAIPRLPVPIADHSTAGASDGVARYYGTTGGNSGIGRLTSVTDASDTTDFLYDARGNLIEEVRSQSGQVYVTSYGYDLATGWSRWSIRRAGS